MSTAVQERLEQIWETPETLWGWLSTVDHKKIGTRYLVTAMVFLIAGGIEALIMRLQLARADQHLLDPETYDQIFSMHAITMIFWYAAPILSGFANYLIPLMIGARDMAFPRLNALSYWAFLLSGLFLYGSAAVFEAPHAGWFAYVPYTNGRYSPGYGMDFYALALIFLTVSTTVGAVNFIVTIFHLRAPGMAISRMPLFLYSTLHHLHHHPAFFSGIDRGLRVSGTRPPMGHSLFRPERWRQSPALAATVLVFWSPLGVRGLSAGHRHGVDDVAGVQPAADCGLPVHCDCHGVDRRGGVRRMAASYVRSRDDADVDEFLQRGQHDHLDLQRRPGIRVAGNGLEGPPGHDSLIPLRDGLHRRAGDRRAERHRDGRDSGGLAGA